MYFELGYMYLKQVTSTNHRFRTKKIVNPAPVACNRAFHV
jgi:hypothetical protein